MKIAVAGSRGFPHVQGGVEKHCEKLCVNLVRQGCEVIAFTRRPYVDPDLHEYQGVRLISINCPRSKYTEAIVHTFKSILYTRNLKPDILHLHAIGPSLFAFLARAMGIKVVITHHGPDYKRKKWPLPAKIFLRFSEIMGVRFANQVIAIADNIADDIKLKYSVESAVIPNGVEIPEPAGTESALKELGIQKREYILAVGRLVPEKGFSCLVDAFNKGDFGKWKLVIVGSADHEDKYSRGFKAEAEKNKNIILTGLLTGRPLEELYSFAGLFVLPSYYEGLPIVLLEAMSYGLSCIASDIPANKCVGLNEERYFKACDVTALAEKIREFIGRPWGESEKMTQIELIIKKYNWEKIAEETLKVYSRL
jgi:glycosyltransferase involved in cell wall biosynthesis